MKNKFCINLKQISYSNKADIILVVLLVIFTAYAGYMALNLNVSLIPDEPAHFTFSKHFATTLGIPQDTYETYSWGWYIKGSPFLYYWINGRLINLIKFIYPGISESSLLISLRLVNVAYGLCTVIFCFLISKEVIKIQWWQLLPVFLLTNILMFVFVSAGVHYDNLANLFSMIALFFFVRVLKQHNSLVSSLAWMISIGLGTLVKYTILPLALIMIIEWLIFIILNRKILRPLQIDFVKTVTLSLIFVLIFIGNFAIYGINLIKYQSITPGCREILLESQCEISPFERRHEELALESKLSLLESISEGYPSPVRYTLNDWAYHILLRTFGLSGHKAYFPFDIISLYQILFYLIVLLGISHLIYWKSFSTIDKYLLGIIIFYTIVLFVKNYNSELTYGFRQVAVQGRYLFPVIGAIIILTTKIIKEIPLRLFQIASLAFLMVLIFWGGPLTLILKYQTEFSSWFK
jgi:hypothetical protein